MGLPMYLGKNASGESMVYDLTKMPHMLIARNHGSGKSVHQHHSDELAFHQASG